MKKMKSDGKIRKYLNKNGEKSYSVQMHTVCTMTTDLKSLPGKKANIYLSSNPLTDGNKG